MLVIEGFEFLNLPHQGLIFLLLRHVEFLAEALDLKLRLDKVLLQCLYVDVFICEAASCGGGLLGLIRAHVWSQLGIGVYADRSDHSLRVRAIGEELLRTLAKVLDLGRQCF